MQINSLSRRVNGIDALRGLAVLLMMEQHLVYWLYQYTRGEPAAVLLGALGGLAAPLFVSLAGLGAAFTASRHAGSDRLYIVRGLGIMACGYLLNALTPHWFSMGSWYVLHLLGFSLALSPILRRLGDTGLLLLLTTILLVTAYLQYRLHIPFQLYNAQMARTSLPGGPLRLALVQGYFPVFPWTAFFIGGLLTGRWLMEGRMRSVIGLAAACLLLSLIFGGIHQLGVAPATGPFSRLFGVMPTFYPSMAPMTLLLMSVAFFSTAGFVLLDNRSPIPANNALVCLGRVSLTFLVLHVCIIREAAVRLHFWRSLSLATTLGMTLGVLILFSAMAMGWRRIGYRYGLEWILRKL